MFEPKKIPVQDCDFYAWEYEEQTKIKHLVLSVYYKIYVSKLGQFGDTLFFDCHGGCGAYVEADGTLHYGSAIKSDTAAKPLWADGKRKSKNKIIICEMMQATFDNLKKVIDTLGIENARLMLYNQPFEEVLKDKRLIARYQGTRDTHYPTFFFIDPFGYNFDMDTLNGLLEANNGYKYFGNEIFINFMFDFINRGTGISKIDTALTNFFGSEEWKNAQSLTGYEREQYLLNLYKTQLKAKTKAKFVFAYRLCSPEKDRTYYYLVHATNSIEGITYMKESFATVNYGRIEYLGKRNNQPSFFDIDFYKQDEITALLKSKFAGKSLTFVDIWEAIVEDTAFLERDLRKTIQAMETKGEITITADGGRKRRGGITNNDVINFS